MCRNVRSDLCVENAIKVERDLDEARELLIAVTDDFEHAKQQLQDKVRIDWLHIDH